MPMRRMIPMWINKCDVIGVFYFYLNEDDGVVGGWAPSNQYNDLNVLLIVLFHIYIYLSNWVPHLIFFEHYLIFAHEMSI